MTDYRDGKIHGWNGGECPVHTNDHTKVWFRVGETSVQCGTCDHLRWSHEGTYGDIIAFQVTKKHREPHVVWVNFYNERSGGTTYSSKHEAYRNATRSPNRQVKFVEVMDE